MDSGSSLAGNIFMDFDWGFSDMFSSHVLSIGFYYIMISLLVGILPILLKGDNRQSLLSYIFFNHKALEEYILV